MADIVIPDEAIEAAGDVYGGEIPDWALRQILENAAPAILAANQAEAEAEAERRGAVKALRAEAQRGHRAAEEFRDDDPYQQRLGRKLLRRTADAIDARADQIESGQVTL